MGLLSEKRKQTLEGLDLVAASALVDGVICWLYNSTPKHFAETFGENSTFLWGKFTEDKGGNEGEFFNYLDSSNRIKLLRSVIADIKKDRF